MIRCACLPACSQPRVFLTARLYKPARWLHPLFRPRDFSSTSIAKSTLPHSPLFDALRRHDPDSTAIVHSRSQRSFTYGSLVHDVAETKDRLSTHIGESLAAKSIAFMVENSYDYVVTLLALLASNARAVPLAPSLPPSELSYLLEHSEALALVSSAKYDALALKVLNDGAGKRLRHVHMGKLLTGSTYRDDISFDGHVDVTGGIMLYTSGTTARPKGVLLDQEVLMAQARSLIQAWEYSSNDRLLHVLPLHHIHGIVNALVTPLLAGSSVELLFPFTPDTVWRRLAQSFLPKEQPSQHQRAPITFLTAVPTVWARLLQTHQDLPPEIQTAAEEAIRQENLRLNISGSAALPVPVKQAWTQLSKGNVLLERFGMTEVGMALSCGLADVDRIDGSVGWPLPTVEARLFDTDTDEVVVKNYSQTAMAKERSGEIQLRGPTIFKGYWRDEQATHKAFTSDGWFKTGDIAVQRPVPGTGLGQSAGDPYFILGRESADIIKMGGEKISALEVERELLSLPQIQECAVVALPSETWGQQIAAVVVLSNEGKTAGTDGAAWSAMDMRRALKGRLIAYKIPRRVRIVSEIRRNAMGKVNKKELVASVFAAEVRSQSV